MALFLRKYVLFIGLFIVLFIDVVINFIDFKQGIFTQTISIISLLFLLLIYYFDHLQKENKALHKRADTVQKILGESKQILQFQKEKVKKFSMIIEQSHDAIMVTDENGIIEYVNEKFTDITEYTASELLGQNSKLVQPVWVTKESEKEFLDNLEHGKAWRSEVSYKKKNGEIYWAFESVSFIKNTKGEVTHYLSTHRDISQEYKLSEKLNYQVSHDELTGLFNRREFEKCVQKLLTSISKNNEKHTVCFMDLDQFKVVNDTCGHVAGDELLRQLSAVLKNIVRKKDILARLGGDEFGILFENCSVDNAYKVTSSILKAIQNFQFSWEGHSFRLSASLGLVEIKETMLGMTDILKAADAACYMAKDSGRNRIQIYKTDDEDLMQREGEIQWVSRINKALDENLFCLYAQLISQIQGKSKNHYELLIRMVDNDGSVIPPGAFLPSAERYNLISKLDRWVIKNAFKFIADNKEFNNQINFCSINLSGQSLTEDGFLDFVITNLQDYDIDNEKICFEITETAAIANLNIAIKFISIIKGMGCRFALDDFGSGVSSFGYLKNLPVDYLKIDGMFVKDIIDDPIDRAMVKSINEIGHVMGMKTIAEFVENDAIKDMLKDLAVDYVQGYGVGKPIPLYDLADEQDNYNLASNY